jgi:hypothetical protein
MLEPEPSHFSAAIDADDSKTRTKTLAVRRSDAQARDSGRLRARHPSLRRMGRQAEQSSRMSGRQTDKRMNKPTRAKTHGWAIMTGLSNCPIMSISQE